MILPEEELTKAFPWIPGVKSALSAIHMHPFDGSHIMVGSDYSGTHAKSKYLVYTFLFADEERSSYWPKARHDWRKSFLADGRRLSFKALNDRIRRRSLQPFLDTLRYLFGSCVSIAVHKHYKKMASEESTLDFWRQIHGLKAKWRPTAFEQMVRTAHLFALLVGHFSRPHQDITWITDEDEIVANDDRLTDTMDFVAQFSKLHVPHKLGVFAMNTTAYGGVSRAFEDFVALPDLVAGALAEYLSIRCLQADWNQEGDLPLLPDLLTPKTELLCSWLCSLDIGGLSRSIIVVDDVMNGIFRVKRIVFEE